MMCVMPRFYRPLLQHFDVIHFDVIHRPLLQHFGANQCKLHRNHAEDGSFILDLGFRTCLHKRRKQDTDIRESRLTAMIREDEAQREGDEPQESTTEVVISCHSFTAHCAAIIGWNTVHNVSAIKV